MNETTQMKKYRAQRVYPVERAGQLDSPIRRWLLNPQKIVGPYVKEGMTALDVGCGPGFFSMAMARMVGASGRVIAADLQDGMLQKVRNKIQGTEFETRIVLHQCSAQRVGWTGSVDFALAFYVVHELPNREVFFREIERLLASNGRFLIVEPVFHVSKAAFEEMLKNVKKSGLIPLAAPRVFFSRSVLLTKENVLAK